MKQGRTKAVRAVAASEDNATTMAQARQRIGDSIPEHLVWLLHFRDQDVGRLSEDAVHRLGWEVLAFATVLGRAPEFPALAPLSLPRALGRAETEDLQTTLRAGLRKLFEEGVGWHLDATIPYVEVVRWPDKWVEVRDEDPTRWRSVPTMAGAAGNFIEIRYEVRWPDTFWLAVASMLKAGSRWLRLCRRCGTLFIGVRRQAYCRAKCSQAVRTKAYRTKQRGARGSAP